MPTVDVKITNLPQIRAAFSKAPGLMRSELNTAIKKTILTIQRRSMINTPVLTGRLRASTRSLFADLRGEVGTNTNYDVFIHEGTRFMKARPYLKDAVDESAGDIDSNFKEAVQNVLDKIGREV